VVLEDLRKALTYLKQRVDQNEDKLDQTNARVDHLEIAVNEDREKTIQSLADHSERLDFESNQSKSHCVLITGQERSQMYKSKLYYL
jgi:TolA-binding protein